MSISDEELRIASKGNMGAIHFGAAWPDKVSAMARELLAAREAIEGRDFDCEHRTPYDGCKMCSYLATYEPKDGGG